MKRLVVILLVVLLAPMTWSDVELMVQGQEYWKDGKPSTNWTNEEWEDFWKQTHKGEIIDVFEGGTNFGTMDIPPVFIRVTVTGVTKEQADIFRTPLLDDVLLDTTYFVDTLNNDTSMYITPVIIKQQRYYFSRSLVNDAIALWDSTGTHFIITKSKFLNIVKQYNGEIVKQKIIDRLKR